MACLTFRRTKLAVPHRMSPALAEHARGCVPCAAFARDIGAFEQRLRTEVAPPRTRHSYTAIVIPLRGGSLGIVADSPEKAVKVGSLIEKQVSREG